MITIAPESKSSRYKVVAGSVALDGSNPTSVQTGLSVIKHAVACIKGTTALGDSTHAVSVDYAAIGGQLDIYGWMPISGADPTHVASTGTDTVDYIAIGY